MSNTSKISFKKDPVAEKRDFYQMATLCGLHHLNLDPYDVYVFWVSLAENKYILSFNKVFI